MSVLRISLFHRLRIQVAHQDVNVEGLKAQELLCYLILFRRKAHPRETLAEQLWGETASFHSRQYLRKALWQLQHAFNGLDPAHPLSLVEADSGWIQFNPAADLWLDTAIVEEAYEMVRGVPGSKLAAWQAERLQAALTVYVGDLLEGWYQDWCLDERRRYQFMYLVLLDKLIEFCTANHEYEAGIEYCMRVLHYDLTREHAHRQLMSLYHLAGNRTAALDQYARCADILRRELDVAPDARTIELYHRIQAGVGPAAVLSQMNDESFSGILARLEEIHDQLEEIQRQVAADIRILRRRSGVKE